VKEKGAIILAAGQGKRMKSKQAKVLHLLAGLPLVSYPLELVRRARLKTVFVIVGHQADAVTKALSGSPVTTILQDPPLGTGHAVLQTEKALKNFSGSLLILNGDTPLLRDKTLRRLWALHQKKNAALTFLTTKLENPHGYGRILRNQDGSIKKIVEEKDATPEERAVREINTGVYIIEKSFLFTALEKVRPDNRQKEYYLTDVVHIAAQEGKRLIGLEADPGEVIGINSRADLASAEEILRKRIIEDWMAKGVTLVDPNRIQIDAAVKIGRDSILHPDVSLEGTTILGEGSEIYSSRIKDSRIGKGVLIKDFCVIEESRIESGCIIGPFAHLRPGTVIRKGAKVGNFVEIKKSDLGVGSKANHLSYIGDAMIGKGVNIGAGTITCNYDGRKKEKTIIEDGVFIGSNSQLVAPVRIGARSLIAAGATITEDVPPDTLAISRTRQENKKGWVKKKRLRAKR